MGRLLLRLLVLLAVVAAPARASVLLNGAGATFPFPLYSKWVAEFSKSAPDIHIDHQPIGSGGGIGQIMAGTVDFGATDGPSQKAIQTSSLSGASSEGDVPRVLNCGSRWRRP